MGDKKATGCRFLNFLLSLFVAPPKMRQFVAFSFVAAHPSLPLLKKIITEKMIDWFLSWAEDSQVELAFLSPERPNRSRTLYSSFCQRKCRSEIQQELPEGHSDQMIACPVDHPFAGFLQEIMETWRKSRNHFFLRNPFLKSFIKPFVRCKVKYSHRIISLPDLFPSRAVVVHKLIEFLRSLD